MPTTIGHAHAAAAGKSTVVAGPYRALWDDFDLGLTLDGYTLRNTNSGIDITAGRSPRNDLKGVLSIYKGFIHIL